MSRVVLDCLVQLRDQYVAVVFLLLKNGRRLVDSLNLSSLVLEHEQLSFELITFQIDLAKIRVDLDATIGHGGEDLASHLCLRARSFLTAFEDRI